MKKGFYVYLYYDKKGNLLYIGQTVDLEQRFRQHFYCNRQDENKYINKVVSIQYVEFSTELEMYAFEAYGINKYKPLHNKRIDNIDYSKFDFSSIYFKQFIYGFNPNPLNRIVSIDDTKCIIEAIIDDNVKRICPDCFTNEYYENKSGMKVCKFCGKVIAPTYVKSIRKAPDIKLIKKRFSLKLIPEKLGYLNWKQSANSYNGFTGKDFLVINT